jgi:thymidine phosphorylase
MTNHQHLIAIDLGINTHQEPVVFMRADCPICKAEGFNASNRLEVCHGERHIIATLNVVTSDVLSVEHIGFSNIALQRLGVKNGDQVAVSHAPLVDSLSAVRKKIFGHRLNSAELANIIEDVNGHHYRDVEIASLLTICSGNRLDLQEIIDLTRAMVNCGKRLIWPEQERIFDKHCIGGLPGNRTTPIVVAIVSAAGLVIPKTSSRAITSPAGTADTMEVLTEVNLDLHQLQAVVHETGACLAWGGAVNLSPADDLLIRIERILDLDGEGQLIASVLSKKVAAGATDVVIDIPVGPTAKVRNAEHAERLKDLFERVGEALAIRVRCVITDGRNPIGFGIGPVEEARDLVAVLRNDEGAPADLRERALLLSAHLLDLAYETGLDKAREQAEEILNSGKAWQQFVAIAEAQGGLKPLPDGNLYQHIEIAMHAGTIHAVDNRRLARLAKLAGAPEDPGAGLRLHFNVGDTVAADNALFTLYSDSEGEKDYALEFYQQNRDMILIRHA